MNIAQTLRQFADANEIELIVDTSAGLNVDRDENVSDAETNGDKNCLFYNIIENGTMQIGEFNRKMNIVHNYEIGILKRCIKETSGEDYFNGIQELMDIASLLFEVLHQEYEIMSASYDTAVDSLDNNNIIVKLNVSITETVNICK